VLPVGDTGQQDLVEVTQHRGERFGLLGSRWGEPRMDIPGSDLGEHRQLADALEIARGPVERGATVRAKVRQAAAAAGNS
jgi:hypothetical protein